MNIHVKRRKKSIRSVLIRDPIRSDPLFFGSDRIRIEILKKYRIGSDTDRHFENYSDRIGYGSIFQKIFGSDRIRIEIFKIFRIGSDRIDMPKQRMGSDRIGLTFSYVYFDISLN